MKVLLLKDVAKIGQKGQIVNVKEGYALNFVLPNKLGIKADQKIIKQKEAEEARNQSEKAKKQAELDKNLAELKGKSITIKEKANEEGHLFAQVKIKEILEAIKKQHNIQISESLIKIKESIKQVGEYDLGVIKLFVEKDN